MADAWFVIPVQPGLLSQIAGYFKGSSGTYKVGKTVVGNPLYDQYMQAGYGPPYSSYAAAVAAAKQAAATGKANALPGSGFSGIPPGSSANKGPKIPNPLQGLAAIGDFFQRLGQANTWVRAGEVVAGLILVAIGLNSMLKGKPLQFVTKTAGIAGKAAMI
jgi:hypothetical protein